MLQKFILSITIMLFKDYVKKFSLKNLYITNILNTLYIMGLLNF
jgi:hypothetical protein